MRRKSPQVVGVSDLWPEADAERRANRGQTGHVEVPRTQPCAIMAGGASVGCVDGGFDPNKGYLNIGL